MKKMILFPAIAVFAICGNVSYASQVLSNRLLGTWTCFATVLKDDVNMDMQAEVTYVRNGRANTFGAIFAFVPLTALGFSAALDPVLNKAFPSGIPLEYSFGATSSWEITHGKFLVETTIDAKFTRTSFPEMTFESRFSGEIPENRLENFKKKMHSLAKLLDLQNSLPAGISESSEIIALSKTSLALVSESDGTNTECIRKN